MGQVFEAQGNSAAANASLRKALKGEFYESDELATLGRICFARGWNSDALQSLQYAVMLAPSAASIRYDLAAVLKAMGRTEEAVAQLAQAQQSDSLEWRARFKSGLSLAKKGETEAAIKAFREAIRLKPDLMEAHLNLGGALLEVGLKDEAAVEFGRALQLSPSNEKLLDYLESIGFDSDHIKMP